MSATGYRKINVLGENFLWKVRKRTTHPYDDELEVPIKHVSGGQLLIVLLRLSHQGLYGISDTEITSVMVRDCIMKAVDKGWEFRRAGAPVFLDNGRLVHG